MEFGLIGHPLGHSFSKEIHESLGLYSYEIHDLFPEDFDNFMTEKNFSAINVTIPYKQKVIPYLDEIDETAREIGAVNTIVNRNGRLYGYNTDIFGITDLIAKTAGNINGKTVLILGSGGTSKTAAFAARNSGAAKIYKATRKTDVSSETFFDYVNYSKLPEIADGIDVLINTTPVGMFPETDVSPVELSDFGNLKAVIDVVYNPLRTKLVLDAQNRGINADGGLYMLVSQAIKAAELFTDKTFGKDVFEKTFFETLNAKRNVVLIGMPGCGKTTVGKLLAEKTGKKFTDTDDVITEKYGHPSEIITSKGEKFFRDTESSVIASLKNEKNTVIAVGGGAVLRRENAKNLKQNGVAVFIDRELSDIVPTSDRPLSSNKEQLQKLYDTRYPVYAATADITVRSDNNAESVAEMIIRELSR